MPTIDSTNSTNETFAWKQKVLDELSKQHITEEFYNEIEDLSISLEDGLTHTYHSTSVVTQGISNDWKICSENEVLDEIESNKKLLEVLMNGSDTLIITPLKNDLNWEELFKDIEFNYITTFVQITNQKLLDSLEKWYSNQPNFFIILEFSSNENTGEIVGMIATTKIPIKLKINGFALQQCGANSQQELAYVANQLHEVILLLENRKNICFQFNIGVGSNFMIEIAKFRALKVQVQTILQQYDIPRNSFEVIGEIGWTNKSLKDPTSNQLRQTTEALSAIIGGVDYLQVHPYDARSVKGDSTFTQRMALNISSILKEESYLKLVKDAYRGSFYLEHLTDKIGDGAWEIFKKLESYNEIHSPKKIELIVSMVNKIVKIRTENFEKKDIKLIGLNVFKNSNPADNEWIKEQTFLGMESFRYEKIECK